MFIAICKVALYFRYLVVLKDVTVAMMSPVANLHAHREGQKRKTMEVASVWTWVSSPYSFHLRNPVFVVNHVIL